MLHHDVNLPEIEAITRAASCQSIGFVDHPTYRLTEFHLPQTASSLGPLHTYPRFQQLQPGYHGMMHPKVGMHASCVFAPVLHKFYRVMLSLYITASGCSMYSSQFHNNTLPDTILCDVVGLKC
jgi:hypothetical protein